MKKILLSLFVPLLFAFSTVSEITPPAKGKAIVYFARTSSYGGLYSFSFFDKDKFIGRFNSTGYIRYECEPGEHVFWATAENRDFATAELEADKIYFIEAEPGMALATVTVQLKPIDPKKQEKKVTKIEKLISKKEPDTSKPEEIEKENNRKEAIAKAVAKYEEMAAKGSKIDRLTKDMYYEKK